MMAFLPAVPVSVLLIIIIIINNVLDWLYGFTFDICSYGIAWCVRDMAFFMIEFVFSDLHQ